METHYARAFAEFMLLVCNARMIFTLKRYSFYKYSYVFVLYGLSLVTSALGVFRYGNPVYGPKVRYVYEIFRKLYTNIGLPFFVIEFYLYQLCMKSEAHGGSNIIYGNFFILDKDNQRHFTQDVVKLFSSNGFAEYNLYVLLFRMIGVLLLHFFLLCLSSVFLIIFRLFHFVGALGLLNIGYIFSIFWFSILNGSGLLNLWGLSVTISAFIDKFILSQHSELGWRLGIPVLLDELRILNLVFFTAFSANALTD